MQKIYYFLWVVLFSIATYAQTIPAGENISLDQQLSNISQTSVTSGIIYERVIPAANLYNFNKVSTFNTANFPYFKQAFSEMRRASKNTKFISLEAFKSLVAVNTNQNEVDVTMLNTQFHILNYNEQNPASGGLTFNTSTNKFVAISGKSSFYLFHNTIIAPAKEYVSGINVVYKMRNDLYFKNGTRTIKTVIADFGDGINRTLISNYILTNQNITINYTTSGEKISKYTITYNDNSTMITYGRIYFKYNPATTSTSINSNITPGSCLSEDPLKQDFILEADEPFTGYNAGDPTIKAKIDYRIFYAFAHTDKKVRKPIIIIDGFDPGDKRKIEDCDCENIPSCAARNTTGGVFDPQKHRAMKDLMEYYDPSIVDNVNLLIKLRTEGYDVIVVNHPTYETTNLQNGQTVTIDGGAYYIESNAMALVKLLQQTKSLLITNNSTNDIAIVAPSMAGQISRFALSYMEKKYAETGLTSWKHNTYLWISVDSPHLGANIPMGDQALLYLLKEGGIDQAADFYDKELSSPAAQQQLIEFHNPKLEYVNLLGINGWFPNYHLVNQDMLNAQTASQNMPNDRGNALFQQHYNDQFNNGLLGSEGWPQNLRKIAVVNGSLSGSKQTQTLNGNPSISFANDGEKVFNLRGFQRVHIPLLIGSITFRVHIASLEANNMPAYGSDSRIARFKKAFDDRTTRSPNINNRGCMDNVPGGFFDAQADIFDSTTSQDPISGINLTDVNNWNLSNFSVENIIKSITEILGGSEWYLHDYNPIHSFIPSFSALGHLEPNQSWSNPLNTNLTCPSNKKTPFDSYFGLDKNTQHTSFTKESVDWLLAELANQPQVPWFPLAENAINGPSHVCENTNSLYIIDDACKVPSIPVWSVEGNLNIENFTDYSITVSGTSSLLSEGYIVATFQNGLIHRKKVGIGLPNVQNHSISGGNNSVYMQTADTFTVLSVPGATEYYWTVTPMSPSCGCTVNSEGLMSCPQGVIFPKFINNSNIFTTSSTSTTINWGNCSGTYVINCWARNICGSEGISFRVIEVVNPNGGGGSEPCEEASLKIYPNPINKSFDNLGEVFISIVYPGGPCSDINELARNNIKIFDLQGIVRYENSFEGREFTINNLNLNRGHYIINVISENGSIIKEIIIVE